jgi:hypothetical protein
MVRPAEAEIEQLRTGILSTIMESAREKPPQKPRPGMPEA